LRSRFDLGVVLFVKNDLEGAQRELKNWVQSSGESVSPGLLGFVYVVMGEKEKALSHANQLRSDTGGRYVSRFSICVIYAALGMKSDALDLLEEAYEWHEDAMLSLRVNPRLDLLRNEPRFQSLLNKLNL
jgi:hypothetical protein